MQPDEITLQTPGLELAARAWGPADGRRVLALHGWLDNAGTWDRVAPALGDAGIRVVALDFPGHGRSQHRSGDAGYQFADLVVAATDALDALGWERAALLGHSMGGGAATLTCAVVPDRVERLALVEGLTPLTTPESGARDQLARAIESRRRYSSSDNRVYATFDELSSRIAARPWRLSPEAVECLALRGSEAVDGGWRFTHDPRLKADSLMRFTPGQVCSFAEAVACPALLIVADEGLPYSQDEVVEYVARMPQLERVEVAGRHHVHLDAPERVAGRLVSFLRER